MTSSSHTYDERVSSSGQHASLLDTQPLMIVDMPPRAQEHALRALLVDALDGTTPEDPRVHRLAFSIAAAISNGATTDHLETELQDIVAHIFPSMTERDTVRKLTSRITVALSGGVQ